MKIIAVFQVSDFHKQAAGFTLIETIIATVLLLTAVVGSVSLITRGIFEFKFAKNKLIATSLAQEGVELVRAIRTNNVICDFLNGDANYAWDRKPGGGNMDSNNPNDYAVDPHAILEEIDCTPPTKATIKIQTPRLTGSCNSPLLFDTSTGQYGYSSGSPSPFSRCVHICTPPNSGKICGRDPDTGTKPVIPPPDQMDVVSIVTWNEAGRDRNVTVRERLYNWR